MTIGKKEKIRVKRRPAGLVITPPKPRPVDQDHPARLLLRDAIESAKASIEDPLQPANTNQDSVTTNGLDVEFSATPIAPIHSEEPLRIFQDLRGATHKEELHHTQAPSKLSTQHIESGVAKEIAGLPFPDSYKEASHTENSQHQLIQTIPQPGKEDGSLDANFGFDDFENSFRKRLSKGQLRVCKVIFERTYAIGATTCLIRVTDLMEQAQVKRRNLFLSLNELEKAGFIERGAVYNTPTKKGMEISFYPVPQIKKTPALRAFHYFDEEEKSEP
jgi:hypothetical protein